MSRGHRYLAGHAATRHRPGAPGKERVGAARLRQDSIRAHSVRETGVAMSLEANERWPDFSDAEALRWSRALLHHSPQPLTAGIKAQMSEALSRGTPVVGPGWVRTAEQAREAGFTPVLYHSLFTALHAVDPDTFRSHPHHRRSTHRRQVPGVPFEPELWHEWPRLVLNDGFSPGTAAELVLLFARSN